MTALWFEHLRGRRPRVGQAARLAGAARDRVPARPARPRVPDDAARVRRPAELPEPAQGPGPGRLLDRLGRDRRDRDDLERARPPLRRRPLRGPAGRPPGRAARRRRARRGRLWEAIVDPVVPHLGEVLWIVDLNRQSLDRIVPDIAAGRLAAMFEAAGWQTITVKYGRWLRRAVRARRRRARCARRIDEMPNEEYQRLLRCRRRRAARAPARQRPRRARARAADRRRSTTTSCCARSATSAATTSATCSTRSPQADARHRPAVGDLRLHDQGLAPADRRAIPANHSALLTDEQWEQLAARARRRRRRPVGDVRRRARRRPSCAAQPRERLRARAALAPSRRAGPGRARPRRTPAARRPSRRSAASSSTSPTRRPRSRARVVTVSPDVASSTNLGGWINRVGIWHLGERIDWFADDTDTLVRWRESEHGQHIELGIAEGNLVGLLGELGSTWSRDGQPLLPIGTLYDPFVNRALEPWSFGMYAGGAVDPGRHAVGRDARARGRRAPVDHHAVGRARAAALHRLGAGVRPGPRVDAAARAVAARPARRDARRTSA